VYPSSGVLNQSAEYYLLQDNAEAYIVYKLEKKYGISFNEDMQATKQLDNGVKQLFSLQSAAISEI
jgi:hypothetical protein